MTKIERVVGVLLFLAMCYFSLWAGLNSVREIIFIPICIGAGIVNSTLFICKVEESNFPTRINRF